MEGLDNLDHYSNVRYLSIPSQQSNNVFSVMKRLSMSWSAAREGMFCTLKRIFGHNAAVACQSDVLCQRVCMCVYRLDSDQHRLLWVEQVAYGMLAVWQELV